MADRNGKKIQCHFISNTHWDREWRFSARRTQYMLGYMLDMLMDILEKNPEFRHFHLDSQTMPVQDYLELYPEKKARFKKLVEEGRIAIGPWFCLPDEFSVNGESLVRNLLLGHKIAAEMGGVSKTGYSPFGWGQISQLPQIYAGFDIHFASFYRGLNTYQAPRSEFFWESPDGTRIYASRLGKRPRYNVWYVVQRPAYFNVEHEELRDFKWNDNNGIFKFTDENFCSLDYQYAHPYFEYFKENVKPRGEQALREQDNDWTTPHRFWSAGHDSSCPDIREVQMIKDLDEALPDAHVFHSTLKEMEQGIIDEFDPNSPVLRGEMRYPYTKGSVSGMFGWILSARTYIKQDNFNTERQLENYAEPMAVFASLLGAPYPKNAIDLSYNYMLQNHGHDSIGACGRDVVYEDVIYRFRQSREMSGCVLERAFMDIAGDIDLRAWSRDDAALVVFNPAPFKRSEPVKVVLQIPQEWNAKRFEIFDTDGSKLSYQILATNMNNTEIIQNPNDVANVLHTQQYTIMLDVKDVPAMGYKTLKVTAAGYERARNPISMVREPQTMENEYLRVSFNANGTFNVLDKETGKNYTDLHYFKDRGEIGDPWFHTQPENDEIFTTLGENARITLLHDGELETSFRVLINWALPEKRAMDEKRRSEHFNPCIIESIVSLRKGCRFVDIQTTVDNRSEDHYLQVGFPTDIKATHAHAQGQFDVVEREIARPDYTLFDEIPMSEQPMNSFVDVSDGKIGAALLNEGLKAYETADDERRTVYLDLMRCYPLRICVTQDMQDYSWEKGSQCLGKNKFHYAFLPHTGNWEEGNVWGQSEQFNLDFIMCQIAPTAHGKNAETHSFLEIGSEKLSVSAVKRAEDESGYVVRLFNPSDAPVKTTINLNGGKAPIEKTQSPVERQAAEFELPAYSDKKWSAVKLISLEEKELSDLPMADDGTVEFEITGKKILTIKFCE